ncbi:SRPBCC family protein [Peribacillus alkalitolerans]|uniref:SRPBCC family protein n=1 Tax=Peribacillus alkalitolerans TaxID=1550385 RepID=UPI0013D6F49C|nr:SRPBCC family protein [Peribacillus alkalitolerans]
MTTTIHQQIQFNVNANRLFQALTDSDIFSQVTGGAPTEIHNEAGGPFSLFGGMIHGRTIELVPNQLIVQAWRAKNWTEGVYTLVKFQLKEDGPSQTTIVFDQTGIPDGQAEHLEKGWHENYWNPLNKYFA